MAIKFYNKNFHFYIKKQSISYTPLLRFEDKLKIKNLEDLNKILSKNEITDLKRDFNFFGNNLSYISGKFLDIKLNDKSLSISNTDNNNDRGIKKFIKIFNKEIESNNSLYLLNNNTEFYLVNYRNRKFIIVLNIIDNIANKKCFNLDGKLITRVKDTLNSNGELSREGENYIVTYKDENIIHIERKIKSINKPSKPSKPLTKVEINNLNDSKTFSEVEASEKLKSISVPEEYGKLKKNNSYTEIFKIKENILKIKEVFKIKESWHSPQFTNKLTLIRRLIPQSKTLPNLYNILRLNKVSFMRVPTLKTLKISNYFSTRSFITLLTIPFLIIVGFLEASLLGWFINNPENWIIPEIIPTSENLPKILPNVESISKIIPRNYPEILSEIPEHSKETEGFNWKTIALLGLFFGILMYAVMKHNTASEMSQVIDSSNKTNLIKDIVENKWEQTPLTGETLEALLKSQGHSFLDGIPLSNAEAAYKTLICPNQELLNESIKLLGNINRNMSQLTLEMGRNSLQMPVLSTRYQLPIDTGRDLTDFVALHKETFINILGDAAAFTPIIGP